MMTLSATPRPIYGWKAETLSFLHVLLVFVNYSCINYEVVFLTCEYSEIHKFNDKEIILHETSMHGPIPDINMRLLTGPDAF